MKADEIIKQDCNHYVNGQCTTRSCLARGGWKPGDDYDKSVANAMCDSREIITLRAKVRELEEHIAELEGVVESFNAPEPTHNNECI